MVKWLRISSRHHRRPHESTEYRPDQFPCPRFRDLRLFGIDSKRRERNQRERLRHYFYLRRRWYNGSAIRTSVVFSHDGSSGLLGADPKSFAYNRYRVLCFLRKRGDYYRSVE